MLPVSSPIQKPQGDLHQRTDTSIYEGSSSSSSPQQAEEEEKESTLFVKALYSLGERRVAVEKSRKNVKKHFISDNIKSIKAMQKKRVDSVGRTSSAGRRSAGSRSQKSLGSVASKKSSKVKQPQHRKQLNSEVPMVSPLEQDPAKKRSTPKLKRTFAHCSKTQESKVFYRFHQG